MRRLYLSGPMTGLPDFNRAAFHAEARRLRALGWSVFNPAEARVPAAWTWERAMRAVLPGLMFCDALVLLPGGEASRGVALELHLADVLRIPTLAAADVREGPGGELFPADHDGDPARGALAALHAIDAELFGGAATAAALEGAPAAQAAAA